MKCPRCGFEQPDDIYCAQCGVEVEKWQSAHRVKIRHIKWYAAGVLVTFALCVVVWLLFISGVEPGPEMKDSSDALLISDDIPRETPPSIGEPPPDNDTRVSEPPAYRHPTPDSKPVPEEILPRTLKEEMIALIAPSGQSSLPGRSRNNFRLYAARDRQMAPIPFQIDCGWDDPSGGEWSAGDKILVMSSDLGDMDDNAYPPRGYVASWRAEVKRGPERGWAYLFHLDYPAAPSERSYIKFSPNPDNVSGINYRLNLAQGHPVTIGELYLGDGPNILDRQKLRIISGENTWTEEDVQGEFTQNIAGPIMARSRWTGTINLGDDAVPVVVENEYLPDRWKTTYSLDFSEAQLPDAVLRIYFDLEQGNDFWIQEEMGTAKSVVVNGKMNEAEHNLAGSHFNLLGLRYSIIVSTNSSAKLFYLDDTSHADTPESSSGCFGCAGFEYKISDSMQFTITYHVFAVGGPIGIAAPGVDSFEKTYGPFKGNIVLLETQ